MNQLTLKFNKNRFVFLQKPSVCGTIYTTEVLCLKIRLERIYNKTPKNIEIYPQTITLQNAVCLKKMECKFNQQHNDYFKYCDNIIFKNKPV